jgi:hypothetical protein
MQYLQLEARELLCPQTKSNKHAGNLAAPSLFLL